jgi:pyridinium-3,5-biscarboxylic acid mononucleotide sulfurtransferase
MTQTISDSALAKENHLLHLFKTYGEVLIAYSGGVDSTYIADVACEALGEKAHLVIADSPSIPRQELVDAVALAEERHWRLIVIETGEFEDEAFLQNDKMRCYYCKGALFKTMRGYADENNIPVIIYGETADDGFDATRVGKQAAREGNAKAPLAEVGFTKDEIRERSRVRNLPTWNKPSFACLASRVPTGTSISPAILHKIERAEALLRSLGCRQYRARHHDTICRIEVAEADFALLVKEDIRAKLVEAIKGLGYRYVTLDLAGYRTGSTAG